MTCRSYLMCLSMCLAASMGSVQASADAPWAFVVSTSTSGNDSTAPSVSSPDRVADTVGKDALASAAAIAASPHAQILGQFSNTVSSDYIIGAEDVLEITVWRNQDLSKIVQVRPDGKFSMPVIRDVTAVGKTASLLADEITKKLKEYVQNPVVAVSVREVNSYSIFLLGEVVKPGKYPLKSKTCLLYTSPSPRDRQKSRMPSSA